MASRHSIDEVRKRLSAVYVSERKRIEKLRKIMERDLGRPVEAREAEAFASDFVVFYKSLAQGRKVVISKRVDNER